MYLSDHLPYAVGTRVFFPHGSGICSGVVDGILVRITKDQVEKEWHVKSVTEHGETFIECLEQNQLAIDLEHAVELAAEYLPAFKGLKIVSRQL